MVEYSYLVCMILVIRPFLAVTLTCDILIHRFRQSDPYVPSCFTGDTKKHDKFANYNGPKKTQYYVSVYRFICAQSLLNIYMLEKMVSNIHLTHGKRVNRVTHVLRFIHARFTYVK